MNAQINEDGFKIYCFRWEYIKKFNLSTYDYDESWLYFLNNADFNEAFMEINSDDIDKYHWDDQLIELNEIGYEKLKNVEYLSHVKFIVVLNKERLYAGEFMPYETAMGLMHPVIFDNAGSYYRLHKNCIQICPDISWPRENVVERLIKRTGNEKINDIKDYFSRAGKMK